MKLFPVIFLLLCSFNCPKHNQTSTVANKIANQQELVVDSSILLNRFACPDSFYRSSHDSSSFAFYLCHLKLKEKGALVKYFDGTDKQNRNVYAAVIDMPIGKKDLQQCADAVMRLRAEYLFSLKQYNKIAFRFLGDGKMHSYQSYTQNHASYSIFLKYMDNVFNYANTASLHKQLTSKPFMDIEPGDVFIQKGNPYGHAVIVMDVCQDAKGNKKFMLAQSYMPAQETQILLNPIKRNSVWYDLIDNNSIQTPEWTFETKDLRTW